MNNYSIKATEIKKWIEAKLSPLQWATLATEALPELLAVNPKFRLMELPKDAYWTQEEVDIINYYLKEYFGMEIDNDVVCDNILLDIEYSSIVNFDKIKSYIRSGRRGLKMSKAFVKS